MTVLPRYKKFLQEMPKNRNIVKTSAIKAGYSPQYADKQGKVILHNALKKEAREIADALERNLPMPIREGKKTMAELVGLSSEDVMNSLKYIAQQQKDLSSALKVLAPLAKEHGVVLQEEENGSVKAPILNVTIKERDMPQNVIDVKDEKVSNTEA